MDETEPHNLSNVLLTPNEREASVQRLSTAFADDILGVEEFERRLDAAYRAVSRADLVPLTADLPGIAQAGPVLARIHATFASVERGGVLDIPARLEVRPVFGNIELDLRAARFQPGVTEIVVRPIFGNVEILLPAGIPAENHVEGFLASVECKAVTAQERSALPVARVRIVGRAIFSNVEVKSAGRG